MKGEIEIERAKPQLAAACFAGQPYLGGCIKLGNQVARLHASAILDQASQCNVAALALDRGNAQLG